MRRLLSGIRVLDLSQYLPGPLAAQMLGDLGASVLKVEPPAGDPIRHMGPVDADGTTAYYKLVNAGKTVIRLDLKTEEGRNAFSDLLGQADVLVESYRPGTLERLGFGRDRLAVLNSSLVHVALSGWGQNGPFRLRAGHDLTYMAVGGGLELSGVPERPVIAFPPVADHAGALQAALAVAAALFERERTGRGAYLDVSLMETVLGWQAASLTAAARSQAMPRGSDLLNGGAACYQIYRTADDRFIAIGALEPKFWELFCITAGRPDWARRQWEPLPQNSLIGEVAALFRSRPLAEWEALFADVDCCVEPVRDPAEMPDHPQIAARGQVRRYGDRVEVLFGLHLDGAPPAERAPLRDVTDAAAAAEAIRVWALGCPPEVGE